MTVITAIMPLFSCGEAERSKLSFFLLLLLLLLIAGRGPHSAATGRRHSRRRLREEGRSRTRPRRRGRTPERGRRQSRGGTQTSATETTVSKHRRRHRLIQPSNSRTRVSSSRSHLATNYITCVTKAELLGLHFCLVETYHKYGIHWHWGQRQRHSVR